MSFAEPARLWLLAAPALAAVAAMLRHRRRSAQQRRLASPAVWRRLMGGVPATGLLRMTAWIVSAALVVVALARPQWGELAVEQSVRTRDLVVAVDVSDSMLCPDVRPSRLARSLEVVQRLMPQLEGNRVGVVVFAGEAYPLVPLTTDLHAVSTFLAAVEPGMIGLPGSNLQRAVETALRLLPDEGEGRVVVLFTDGENLQGDMEGAATRLREAGVSVLAVAAGTEAGGPIPMLAEDGSVTYKRDSGDQPVVTRARPDVLAALARSLEGEVLEIADRGVEAGIVAAVERLRTREVEETRTVQRVDRFPLFLAAAGLALVTSFAAAPWRRAAGIAVLCLASVAPASAQLLPSPPPAGPAQPASAPAVGPAQPAPASVEVPHPSWWQRLVPGGSRRLARSGAAKWRSGELDKAGHDFASAAVLDPENSDRLYDLGTVLMAGGLVEQGVPVMQAAHERGAEAAAYNAGTGSLQHQQAEVAVRWLREALLKDPDNPDVKRNYELALRLLEKQQEEKNEEQQEQEQEQEDQEQQEQQEQGDQQQPTPTPTPSPSDQPAPTPTPDPNNPLWAALERAEADARDAMRSPTPQAMTVEKDW